MTTNEVGIKHDAGKIPWELFPWLAAQEVCKVLREGAKKYLPRNWEKGMNHSRMYAASLRHHIQYFTGEDLDPEWALHHLAHAACETLMLLELILKGKGTDDRPLERQPEKPLMGHELKETDWSQIVSSVLANTDRRIVEQALKKLEEEQSKPIP